MLGTSTGCPNWSSHDQRYLAPAAGHIPHLGGVVDDLIARQKKKVAVLDIGNRLHSHHSSTYRDAKEAEFSNGGVNHPLRELFFETQGDRKGASPSAWYGDIFPNAEDGRVSFHFFGDGI